MRRKKEVRKSGRASDYIGRLTIQPGDKFIVCARASSGPQDAKNNTADQLAWLQQTVAERGGEVIRVVQHVGSGTDPLWLRQAAEQALTDGAILLAESTDRFIRHPAYHSKLNPNAQAGRREFTKLRRATMGAKLMTYLHPDASPGKVRAQQTRRGQWAKGKRGGRPIAKKCVRELKLPQALKLRAGGASLGMIAKELDMAKSTIQGWIERYF